MPILIDNTVLSNFAFVERFELLYQLFGDPIVITDDVQQEFQAGNALGLFTDPQSEFNVIECTAEEKELMVSFQNSLNAGEASCLAIAIIRGGRILTDDRDARKVAAQRQISISGTLGVLLLAVDREHLTVEEANRLLQKMIEKGYRSPVSKLEDVS